MFDRGNFDRSKLYFAYLQQLRIFAEWIDETRTDLLSLKKSYTKWLKIIVSARGFFSPGHAALMMKDLQEMIDTHASLYGPSG
jgi:hypothetical protein